jgi:hypothetical protein
MQQLDRTQSDCHGSSAAPLLIRPENSSTHRSAGVSHATSFQTGSNQEHA